MAIRIAPPEVAVAHRGGFVVTAATFARSAAGALEAVADGLYDETTFGPLPRGADGSVDLAAYQATPYARRPQLCRPGELVLEAPALHPWLRRYAPNRVAAQAGVTVADVEALLAGRRALRVEGLSLVDPPDGTAFGAEALWHLARSRGCLLEGYLRAVPVLPAGLRPPSPTGELPTPTRYYQALFAANDAARERCAADTVAAVQSAVDRLHLASDGLARAFTGTFGAGCLEDLARVTDLDSFILTLRGPLYVWRAALEAAGFEIVLLTADGDLDEGARREILVDSAAGRFHEVYEQLLGAPWLEGVMHGPLAPGLPHVDVHTFAPRAPGEPATLITGGMSTRLMRAGARAGLVELVCLVPVDVPRADAAALAEALLELALHPFRTGAVLGPGDRVPMPRPTGALAAWTLLRIEDDWALRIGDQLPGHPELLLAVGVSEAELSPPRDRRVTR